MILIGDSLEELKKLEPNSVDSIVTDPPYGLSFMGKKWDYDVPSVDLWKEVYRVLKPGGHLLSFGGTRTYHRLVVAIEDAGFEIRDQIQWLYGSGFPKSQNVTLQIDKQAGAIGNRGKAFNTAGSGSRQKGIEGTNGHGNPAYTDAITDAAKTWQGWGTALKPANEPICVARKPLEKGLTVAANVLKWGTGAINVDASRVEYQSEDDKKCNTEALERFNSTSGKSGTFMASKEIKPNLSGTSLGRWPANIILDEEAGSHLDLNFGDKQNPNPSKFFYVAKASKKERNAGLEGMPLVESGVKNDSGRGFSESDPHKKILNQNFHPTVKPVKLMEYLVKLVTPPNGIVLDPFLGSGTTGVAAKSLGFKFVGIELNPEYAEIAKKRIG